MNDSLIAKLENYTVPQNGIDIIKATKIVFLVGVAGAGKDTVIGELLKTGDYHYIISHTTRQPRYNHGILEVNNVDYHFITPEQAEAMLDKNQFIEAKLVHGNVYGTSVAEIQAAKDRDEIAISEIEVQGIAEYRTVSETVLPIFLLPPDFETWQQRLLKRYEGDINQEELAKRLATAKLELEEALSKDYYEFVINSDLANTIEVVHNIASGVTSSVKNDQAKEVARQILAQL
jgi:guanylate kinase